MQFLSLKMIEYVIVSIEGKITPKSLKNINQFLQMNHYGDLVLYKLLKKIPLYFILYIKIVFMRDHNSEKDFQACLIIG